MFNYFKRMSKLETKVFLLEHDLEHAHDSIERLEEYLSVVPKYLTVDEVENEDELVKVSKKKFDELNDNSFTLPDGFGGSIDW